ncbi:hypothetical protein [Ruegeria arenilitoris]|uniref:hypothetical protein n=1 Tax=Ruegeria arenilitoris TaxID=1173585 RepID=UPI00147BCD56|nr:hypothetical protein [Ruegeria arenilitoris]
MPEIVKVFGERNTSTNALTSLICKNSRSSVAPSTAKDLDPGFLKRIRLAEKLGVPSGVREWMTDRVFVGRDPLSMWKHTATNFDDVASLADTHVVFCVRHPASWILGLYKRPYHVHGRAASGLTEFLDKRWKTVGRERLNGRRVGAIELYNIKMHAYSELQQRLHSMGISHSIVRHEDFAVDQHSVFEKLKPYLVGPNTEFSSLDASTKDQEKSREYYRDYYGGQKWRNEIDADSMQRINEEIEWQLLEVLSYYPVNCIS